MRRIERPLDQEAAQSADDQIHAAHEDDPRPNALFDADGNPQPLSPTDPTQEALRQEWKADYFAALDAQKAADSAEDDDDSPPPSPWDSTGGVSASAAEGCDPGNPIVSCEKKYWITIQYKPFKNSEKRPDFWPALPDDDAYACEFYAGNLTSGYAEGYLDGNGLSNFPNIPQGKCQIKLPNAFDKLQQYFDRVVRQGSQLGDD